MRKHFDLESGFRGECFSNLGLGFEGETFRLWNRYFYAKAFRLGNRGSEANTFRLWNRAFKAEASNLTFAIGISRGTHDSPGHSAFLTNRSKTNLSFWPFFESFFGHFGTRPWPF